MRSIRVTTLTDDPTEERALSATMAQAYDDTLDFWPRYRDVVGRDNFRVVYVDDAVVGGLAIFRLGQWFGGRSVPMAGIAAVAIDPSQRGTGVGVALMRATVEELAAEGVALSTLYPSTQRPYRRVGYEQAGARFRYEIDCNAIDLEPIQGDEVRLPVNVVDAACHDAFHEIERERARRNDGNLDRTTAIWQRLVDPTHGRVFAYTVGDKARPQGYLIIRHATAEPKYDVVVRDMVALTPAALRQLWSILAGHRSAAGRVRWFGPAVDPRALVLGEQRSKVGKNDCWMTRIVDVKAALATRGYPPGVAGELHLAVRDPLVQKNDGHVLLTVRDGSGTVEAGGRGELRVDVSALAPLYTGLFTASQLADIGRVVATPAVLAMADAIFRGTAPWMPDGF